jgi:hypothetical protein
MIINGKLTKVEKLAIHFFADKLLTKQIKPYIMVRIRFTKRLDIAGEIEISDYNMRDLPRGFVFHIQKGIGQEETLRTIAHEMVHLKQYCKKELNEQMNVWCGVTVNPDIIPYDERPWEIEAHKIGDLLYDEFIGSLK